MPDDHAVPDHPRRDRYARQVLLPGVGEVGQQRLAKSVALIAGCGALGTVIAETLCRAGVGRLVIVDRDYVEWSNLQRQVLFDESDAEQGLPKAVAAKRKLQAINRETKIDAVVADIHSGNVEQFAGVADVGVGVGGRVGVMVDGLDNFETRYLLNDVAVKHGIPYVYGGAVGTAGTAMVVLPHSQGPDVKQEDRDTPWEKLGLATPDLRDLFEAMPPPGSQPTCDTAGVLGPAVSVVASWQSAEALKVLLGRWEDVNRQLLSLDLWRNTMRQFDISGAYEASAGICSKQRRFEFLDRSTAGGAVTMCGRGAVQVSPAGATKVDLPALGDRFRGAGESVLVNPFLVRGTFADRGEKIELTVFEDGRVIVKGTTDGARARGLVSRWVGV